MTIWGGVFVQPVYIDIHIHTSDNPNIINKDYDVDSLLEKIKEVSKGKEVLISLTDHNTLNRNAYMALCDKDINVIMGAELHIKKYDSAPPYHCHILFDCDVSEKNIESINGILDELYPDKVVTDTTLDIPNIEKISNAFDNEVKFCILSLKMSRKICTSKCLQISSLPLAKFTVCINNNVSLCN